MVGFFFRVALAASTMTGTSKVSLQLHFGLPHGQALEIAPRLPTGLKVIDLSGDFRLRDADVFEEHYGRAHTAGELQREFVYGLTELNREAIKSARLISNPGCFAT